MGRRVGLKRQTAHVGLLRVSDTSPSNADGHHRVVAPRQGSRHGEIMEKPVQNNQRREPVSLLGEGLYLRYRGEAGEGGDCGLYPWRTPGKGKTPPDGP